MLKYALISETGDRANNEDSVKVASVANRHCFVVCDGLGGHDQGDVASKAAVNAFADMLCFADNLEDFLPAAFNNAQRSVLEKQKSTNANEMKTTAVALVTDEQTAFVGHIGDSRFYAFTKDGQYIRTLDHSIPQILVNSKTIEEKDIRNHPSRNMLLKVIGEQYDETLTDLFPPFPVDNYCAYLLCSDGFWELIEEETMVSLLSQSATPQDWLDKMVDVVRSNGKNHKMDNYSAIVIFNDL